MFFGPYYPTHIKSSKILCNQAEVLVKEQSPLDPHTRTMNTFNKRAITFRSPHTYHEYFSYCIIVSRNFMLSYDSFICAAKARRIDGFSFPLWRRMAFRLSLEESINNLHSPGLCCCPNASNKESTSLQ